MTNFEYGFVILHYMAFEMTCECVDLLLKNFSGNKIHIVIVDNASSNGSGRKISDYYHDCNEVTVILNDKNEGFARGNNLGYAFLKENTSCDFITVMNNDVLIKDIDFLNKIVNVYGQIKYAVLGPDIYNPYSVSKHQNPFFLKEKKYEELLAKKNELIWNLEHFNRYYVKKRILDFTKSLSLLRNLYRFVKYKVLKCEQIDYTQQYINPILHGSCYVLSRDFIDKRNFVFNPNTFLYYEENILYHQCIKESLLMIYYPDIQVVHLEDVSTNMVYTSAKKKEIFKMKNMIESLNVYINLLECENGR